MSTEFGFTGGFIPAVIEIIGKVSSDFSPTWLGTNWFSPNHRKTWVVLLE